MAVRTIPAQTIKTCDCCGDEVEAHNGRKEAKLMLKQHALDMKGFACADASRSMDLCDACAWKMENEVFSLVNQATQKGGA